MRRHAATATYSTRAGRRSDPGRCSSGRKMARAPMNRIDTSNALIQLPPILGSVEMALGGSNQAVASDAPSLKAADADPVPRPSRPGIGAGKSPVILGFLGLEPKVIHDHAEIREGSHKGLRHVGDGVASDGRRVIVDTQ